MESVWKQRRLLGFQMFPLEGLSIRYNTRYHLLTSRHGERPPWLGDMDFECPPHPLASLRQAFFPLDPSPLLPPTASKSHFCKPNNCEPVLILYSDCCLYIPLILPLIKPARTPYIVVSKSWSMLQGKWFLHSHQRWLGRKGLNDSPSAQWFPSTDGHLLISRTWHFSAPNASFGP